GPDSDSTAPGPIPLTRLRAGQAPQWAGVVRMVIGDSRRWATRMRRIGGERLTTIARPDGSGHLLAAGCTPAAGLERLLSPAGPDLRSAGLPAGPPAGRVRRAAPAARPRPMLVVGGSSTDALSTLSVAEIGVVVGDGLAGIDRLRHVRRVPALDRR